MQIHIHNFHFTADQYIRPITVHRLVSEISQHVIVLFLRTPIEMHGCQTVALVALFEQMLKLKLRYLYYLFYCVDRKCDKSRLARENVNNSYLDC